MASSTVAARTAPVSPVKELMEDLELSMLMQRLEIIKSQRAVAALHCERFLESIEFHGRGTDALEAEYDSYYSSPSIRTVTSRRTAPRSRTVRSDGSFKEGRANRASSQGRTHLRSQSSF